MVREKEQVIDFIKFSREWIASTSIKGAPNNTTAVNALVRFVSKEELDINSADLYFATDLKNGTITYKNRVPKKDRKQVLDSYTAYKTLKENFSDDTIDYRETFKVLYLNHNCQILG